MVEPKFPPHLPPSQAFGSEGFFGCLGRRHSAPNTRPKPHKRHSHTTSPPRSPRSPQVAAIHSHTQTQQFQTHQQTQTHIKTTTVATQATTLRPAAVDCTQTATPPTTAAVGVQATPPSPALASFGFSVYVPASSHKVEPVPLPVSSPCCLPTSPVPMRDSRGRPGLRRPKSRAGAGSAPPASC